MNYIFGYGSLIYADGINGRDMRRQYIPEDLIEAHLHFYVRKWNAFYACDNQTYLGIESVTEFTKEVYTVNGVIFPINDDDMQPFLESEYSSSTIQEPLYILTDVSNLVIPDTPVSNIDRIFTLVTAKPAYNGIIPFYYKVILRDALQERSPEFVQEFLRTTRI